MKRLPLFVEPGAEAEAAAQADYFEGEQAGLGTRFLADLADALERVHAAPEAAAPVHYEPRARSVRVGRFHWRVFFVIEKERVRVVTIAHEGRNPESLKGRLEQP